MLLLALHHVRSNGPGMGMFVMGLRAAQEIVKN